MLRRKGPVLAAGVVLAAAGLWYGSDLGFSTSRIDLVPRSHPARKAFVELLEEFGPQNRIVVVVSGAASPERRAFCDAVTRQLEADPSFGGTVLSRIDPAPFLERAPYYLDLQALGRALEVISDVARDARGLPDAGSVLASMADRLDALADMGPEGIDQVVPLCRLLEGVLRGMSAYLAKGVPAMKAEFLQSASEALPAPPVSRSVDEKGYLQSPDGRLHLVLVTPGEQTEEVEPLAREVEAVRRALSSARARLPGTRVSAGLTGIPISVLEEDESVRRDIPRCSLAAALANLTVLLLGFPARPGLAFVAIGVLGAGIAWTAGVSRLLVTRLNLISSVFGLFLVGLGINHAIYYACRFHQEDLEGVPPEEAARRALMVQGPGMVTSALATGLAFLSLVASSFPGFRQLGLMSGLGLFLCLAATLTLYPPLWLALRSQGGRGAPRRHNWLDRRFQWLDGWVRAHWAAILGFFCLVTAACAVAGDPFPFDYDLDRTLPEGAESVAIGEVLQRSGAFSPLSAVLACDTEGSLKRVQAALRSAHGVGLTLSRGSFIPLAFEEKRAILEMCHRSMELPHRLERTAPPNPFPYRIERELRRLQEGLSEADKTLENLGFDREAEATSGALTAALTLERHVSSARRLGEGPGGRRLEDLGREMLEAWEEARARIGRWRDVSPPPPSLVPAPLRRSLRGRTGKLALIVSPAEDLHSREAYRRFHETLTRVARGWSGYPVVMHTMVGLLPPALLKALCIALAVVCTVLYVEFRSAAGVLKALVPVIGGVLWLSGLMKLFGLSCNPVNFLAFPMVLGIGVENGLYFLRTTLDGEAEGALALQGRPMLLSAATTILGFGALAGVSHRGLASFGTLLALGTACCLVAGVVLLPALDHGWKQRRAVRRHIQILLTHRIE